MDDSDRMRKVSKKTNLSKICALGTGQVLESRAMQDEERMAKLEEELKEVKITSVETLLLQNIVIVILT